MNEKSEMIKGERFKRQVIEIDMAYELASGAYTLDKEIASNCMQVSHIAMYTKNGQTINIKNCKLFEPLKIDNSVVYPSDFDTRLLYPIPGSDCETHQQVNIPVQSGSRIKSRIVNPENATSLIIVLQLKIS